MESNLNVEYIDYSSLWFGIINKMALPPQRRGKFILIANGRNRWAVFSPTELSKYHANIAERFCHEHTIAGAYNVTNTHYHIHDNQWQILGGGKWEADDEQGLMVIYGSSDAYGRVDLEWLAKQLKDKGLFVNVFVH